MENQTAVLVSNKPQSLIERFASKFGVEPSKLLATLKATAFRPRDGMDVSNEQMMGLLIVANEYGLNPWTKEIYAFPDKSSGIVPVVGVDGWLRLMNSHPQHNGVSFNDGPVGKDGLPEWIECTIHRKDREFPIVVREYMAECKRATPPWGSHPRRLLRHKSLIQGNRVAYGFVGIYDEDEAERIIEGTHTVTHDAAIDELNASVIAPNGSKLIVNDDGTARVEGNDVGLETLRDIHNKNMANKAAPPLDLTGGPNFADVLSSLRGAKTPDDIAAAEDMARSLKLTEQQTAELDVEIRAAMKRLAK